MPKIPPKLRKRKGRAASQASDRSMRVLANPKSTTAQKKVARKTLKLAEKAIRSHMKAHKSSDPHRIRAGKPGPVRTRTGRNKALKKLHTIRKKKK